jgi:AcrR family transcriptional regulator
MCHPAAWRVLRQFDSKEELFAAAFADGLEQVSERLVRAAETAAHGGEWHAMFLA